MILPSTEVTTPIYDPRRACYHYDVRVSDKEAKFFGIDAARRAVERTEEARILHHKSRTLAQRRKRRMAKWKGARLA